MVNLAVFIDEKSGLIYIFSNNIKIIIWNGNKKHARSSIKTKEGMKKVCYDGPVFNSKIMVKNETYSTEEVCKTKCI